MRTVVGSPKWLRHPPKNSSKSVQHFGTSTFIAATYSAHQKNNECIYWWHGWSLVLRKKTDNPVSQH
jgi:hypothetical protein